MNRSLSSLNLCKTCLECLKGVPLKTNNSQVILHTQKTTSNIVISHRSISTTVVLQRKKRKASRYVPPIIPFSLYGNTHRLMRGANVKFDRYGPLFDKPDYTFLDGRPTPLTPEQMEQKIERRQMAETVVKFTRTIMDAKEFNENLTKNREKRNKVRKEKRLIEKS